MRFPAPSGGAGREPGISKARGPSDSGSSAGAANPASAREGASGGRVGGEATRAGRRWILVGAVVAAALATWRIAALWQPDASIDRPSASRQPAAALAASTSPGAPSSGMAPQPSSEKAIGELPLDQPAPGRQAPKPLLSSAPPTVPDLSIGRETSPDPNKRQRAEASAAKARVLDSRLERHIEQLKARLDHAGPAERRAISADLELLERNLGRRRAWENDGVTQANRPTASPR